ncbi:MAG: hypothetical protein Ct9H300mP1_09010 [Planctomycetaceae bacterium]|nr:MAG: hypothetical protein Ct9H300mP1_09010 [Planctomycetaceae bacterium]
MTSDRDPGNHADHRGGHRWSEPEGGQRRWPSRFEAFAIWRDPERLARIVRIAGRVTVAEAWRYDDGRVGRLLRHQGAGRSPDSRAGKDVPLADPSSCGKPAGIRSVADAVEIPRLVAAANWHALATFAGRLASDGHAVLLDVGTTTTDIIPLTEGVPVPSGLTDRERLECGELVYTGVVRSPVCSIVSRLTVGGRPVEVAAELFATTGDVYLLTGDRDENPGDLDTANGEPATRTAAAGRLARMICCDTTELDDGELMEMATEIAGSSSSESPRLSTVWSKGHSDPGPATQSCSAAAVPSWPDDSPNPTHG